MPASLFLFYTAVFCLAAFPFFLPVFPFSFPFFPFSYVLHKHTPSLSLSLSIYFSLNIILVPQKKNKKEKGKRGKNAPRKGFFIPVAIQKLLDCSMPLKPHISIHSNYFIYGMLISNQDHNKHHKPLAQLFSHHHFSALNRIFTSIKH